MVGLDDPEGDLITRIREVVGKETINSTSIDLHENVSWRLAQNKKIYQAMLGTEDLEVTAEEAKQ